MQQLREYGCAKGDKLLSSLNSSGRSDNDHCRGTVLQCTFSMNSSDGSDNDHCRGTVLPSSHVDVDGSDGDSKQCRDHGAASKTESVDEVCERGFSVSSCSNEANDFPKLSTPSTNPIMVPSVSVPAQGGKPICSPKDPSPSNDDDDDDDNSDVDSPSDVAHCQTRVLTSIHVDVANDVNDMCLEGSLGHLFPASSNTASLSNVGGDREHPGHHAAESGACSAGDCSDGGWEWL